MYVCVRERERERLNVYVCVFERKEESELKRESRLE